MRTEVITPPAESLLTLEETKRFLGESDGTYDGLITDLIHETHQLLDGPQGRLGRSIMPQTLRLHLPCFPPQAIALGFGPVRSVTSIQYEREDGTTVDAPMGVLYEEHGRHYLLPPTADGWPRDVRAAVIPHFENVHITYEAGDAMVPGPVKQAARMMVHGAYDNRSDRKRPNVQMDTQVERLLSDYRLGKAY